jgi:hypothetical protein
MTPTFPFDLARAIDRICGDECGAPVEVGVDCIPPTCEFHRRRIAALKDLHEKVEIANHVVDSDCLADHPDEDFCEGCAFGSMCTVSFGSRYEPPEYGLWCNACQSLVEECECHGKFFFPKPEDEGDEPDHGDIEPEELR